MVLEVQCFQSHFCLEELCSAEVSYTLPPKVAKGRHIKSATRRARGYCRGASRSFRGIFSRDADYVFACIYFRERLAAIFHDPLDPPGSAFKSVWELLVELCANVNYDLSF